MQHPEPAERRPTECGSGRAPSSATSPALFPVHRTLLWLSARRIIPGGSDQQPCREFLFQTSYRHRLPCTSFRQQICPTSFHRWPG